MAVERFTLFVTGQRRTLRSPPAFPPKRGRSLAGAVSAGLAGRRGLVATAVLAAAGRLRVGGRTVARVAVLAADVGIAALRAAVTLASGTACALGSRAAVALTPRTAVA